MKARLGKSQLKEGILHGNDHILSQSITLIESTLVEDIETSIDLLDSIIAGTGKSIRLGLTGAPGVGKSTFINSFGKIVLEHGHKLAVLAVDPSSTNSKGSILGDKTRMHDLLNHQDVFVRPTPTGQALGGVARKTRETMLLCEAAGYDFIIIETVGIGQSEIAVKDMVDFLILLLPPVGGDEVQGIKKGIMEHADGIVITKADGEMASVANRAKTDVLNAIKILGASNLIQKAPVLVCSSVENTGLSEIYKLIMSQINFRKRDGLFSKTRDKQHVQWMHDELLYLVYQSIYQNPKKKKLIESLEKRVLSKDLSPQAAARQIFGSD